MANSIGRFKSNFSADQTTQNPILLRFLPFSSECSAFAFFALAIFRSNINCVTYQRFGFSHPAWIAFTQIF